MPSAVLQNDLKAGYLAHKAEIDPAVSGVLNSGWYILGQQVTAFEQAFAQYLDLGHVVGVGSGTEALHLALLACGIGPGCAVATVSHTAVATVAAIALAGATPILVDIDPVTFTMHPEKLEATLKAYRGRIRAVIPVHLYGHPADMPAILEIARRHDLYVIEDCAQAHGATLQGRKTGLFGHLAAFSFYPTKNLGALGDGGAVATQDAHLAEQVRLLREYGWRERYVSAVPGLNSRLDEIQAAILHAKLPYLDPENARRRELARLYDTGLAATPLVLPYAQAGVEHVYHQYVVRSARRDALRAFLKANAVGTLIHYPVPVHLQPAYQGRDAASIESLPITERVCREVLSLPMYPQLADEQIGQVCDLIARWHTQAPDAR